MSASTERDIAWEEHLGETRDFAINEVATRFNLTGEVIQESGPGGGWPVVRFTGELTDVQRFEEWYDSLAG
jgi:hypothetical protein